MMELPGGFKPNPNLAQFIGHFILDLIYIWNYATTAFNLIQWYIITNLAYLGIIGSTFLLAVTHDVLFVCSSHIFFLYSLVANIYNFILRFLQTMIRLFNGKKFNVKRNRVDKNDFTLVEFYLGVLIVTLIIFLLPTLAMFYFCAFIGLVVSVLILQILLLIAQILSLDLPFHLFFLQKNKPYILPNSVNIEPMPEHNNHIRMVPIKSSQASMFIIIADDFKKLAKVSSPAKVVNSIALGTNLLRIMRNLLRTLERVDNPDEAEAQRQNDDTMKPKDKGVESNFVFVKELFKIAFY